MFREEIQAYMSRKEWRKLQKYKNKGEIKSSYELAVELAEQVKEENKNV